MQYLGQGRMHALAQAGSKNDDIQFGHINEGYLEIVNARSFVADAPEARQMPVKQALTTSNQQLG